MKTLSPLFPAGLFKRHRRLVLACLAPLVLIFAASCANLSVKKVPTPTQYQNWSDADQKAADSMEGFRYNMPRPFVAVKKEFVVESETRLANGTLSMDGRLVSLDTKGLPADWHADLGNGAAATREVFVAPGAAVLKPPGVQGDGGSGGGSAPQVFEQAGAVAVSGLAVAHVGKPSQPVSFALKVTKAGLGTDDCKLGSIRGFYLAPVAGGKVGALADFYQLPNALYVPKDDGSEGTLTMKGALLTNIKAGSYVFAVRFAKAYAGTVGEYVFCNPANLAQLTVAADWSTPTDPALGADNLAKTVGPTKLKGFSGIRQNNITGPGEKVDVGFTVLVTDLKGADGRPLDGLSAGGASIGLITGMGLVADKAGQPDATDAVRLPFTGGTAKATAGVVDFAGVVDYERSNSKKLHAGNYYFAAWVTTDDGTGTPATALVVTENTMLNIGSFVTKVPDLPKGGTGVATTTPKTGTSAGGTGSSGSGSSGASGGSTDDGTNMQSTTKQQVPAGEMAVGLRGNPTSSPVIPVNELFDVLMLQDFDEQYAVQAKPRLGHATVEIALKQGWMLENATADIDNKAIAQFIFDQAGKTLDLARDLVRLDKGLLAPVAGSAAAAAVGKPAADSSVPAVQGDSGTPVRAAVFRLHKKKYAVPGLYPLLKPREIQRADSGNFPGELIRAGSMLRFATREEIVVELISFAGPPAGATDSPSHIAPEELKAKAQAFADASPQFSQILVTDAKNNLDNEQVFVTGKNDAGKISAADKAAFEKALNEKAETDKWGARRISVKDAVPASPT